MNQDVRVYRDSFKRDTYCELSLLHIFLLHHNIFLVSKDNSCFCSILFLVSMSEISVSSLQPLHWPLKSFLQHVNRMCIDPVSKLSIAWHILSDRIIFRRLAAS